MMSIRGHYINTVITKSQASNSDANSVLESKGTYHTTSGVSATSFYQYYTDSSNVARSIVTSGSAVDLAEWYKVGSQDLDDDGDSTLVKGEVLCIDPDDKRKMIACTNPYDDTMAGIVSTQSYTTMGMNDLDDDHHDSVELGLIGQVPTIVTTKNGVINAGDIITSSDMDGVGMKATHKGSVVGSALETSDNWNSNTCENISNVGDIDWPHDDGTNENNPCFKLPD
ncbi:MAG: hypothetical protein U9Q12_02795, partial [Patescibacteria group bacterium]|nr:hypothetical protein [Patescibacteria group bacterium]